ncbi:hypothetical protein BDB00DRAFT_878929 [Zychaea mexicana]|uniref:uncharacterized protein n=1 Tax=Zychaea mexicana TaxID=64656 RepID=UPI0022FDD0A1|nr:uncharacterized protein BDB00DRAFT_878929 [Zychaea mexicana]KAI9484347.1 hypothetical protein BDB00DRAFT_878929 [Zychaea mexicana]
MVFSKPKKLIQSCAPASQTKQSSETNCSPTFNETSTFDCGPSFSSSISWKRNPTWSKKPAPLSWRLLFAKSKNASSSRAMLQNVYGSNDAACETIDSSAELVVELFGPEFRERFHAEAKNPRLCFQTVATPVDVDAETNAVTISLDADVRRGQGIGWGGGTSAFVTSTKKLLKWRQLRVKHWSLSLRTRWVHKARVFATSQLLSIEHKSPVGARLASIPTSIWIQRGVRPVDHGTQERYGPDTLLPNIT